jgi:hypothetical protein
MRRRPVAECRERRGHRDVSPAVRAPRLRNPCAIEWESLEPGERTRHCARCSKDVTDLSAKRPAEAERFVAANPDACLRFRADHRGHVVFSGRRVAALAVVTTMSACATWQEGGAPSPTDVPVEHVHAEPEIPNEAPRDEEHTRVPAAEHVDPNPDPSVDADVGAEPRIDTENAVTDPRSEATDSERAPLERRVRPAPEYTRREIRQARRPRRTRTWTGR